MLDQSSIGDSSIYAQFITPVKMMVGFSLYINVLLGVFNLIPVPPLDGGRILAGILPERQAALLSKLESFGFVLILFLVFFTDVWSLVLGPIINTLVIFLAGDEARLVEQSIRFLFGH